MNNTKLKIKDSLIGKQKMSNFKIKYIIISASYAALTLSTILEETANAQTANKYCVSGLSDQAPNNYLVLRNAPNKKSTKSNSINFKNGDNLEILGDDGDYYKVRAQNGEIGWSAKTYIFPCPNHNANQQAKFEQEKKAEIYRQDEQRKLDLAKIEADKIRAQSEVERQIAEDTRRRELDRLAQQKREDDNRKLEIARAEAQKAQAEADTEKAKLAAEEEASSNSIWGKIASLFSSSPKKDKEKNNEKEEQEENKIVKKPKYITDNNSNSANNKSEYSSLLEFVQCGSSNINALSWAVRTKSKEIENYAKKVEIFSTVKKYKIQNEEFTMNDYDILYKKEIENKNIFPVGKDFNWWIKTCDEALTNSIKNNKYIK